jgi:hypothetical protein
MESSASFPPIEVLQVNRDRNFTIDCADSDSKRSSWDSLDEEKARVRAQAIVSSQKDKPRKVVRIVERTETSQSHPDREAENGESAADEGEKKARQGLATPPRKQATDSGYRIRVDMYNVSIILFQLSSKLLCVSFVTAC